MYKKRKVKKKSKKSFWKTEVFFIYSPSEQKSTGFQPLLRN